MSFKFQDFSFEWGKAAPRASSRLARNGPYFNQNCQLMTENGGETIVPHSAALCRVFGQIKKFFPEVAKVWRGNQRVYPGILSKTLRLNHVKPKTRNLEIAKDPNTQLCFV